MSNATLKVIFNGNEVETAVDGEYAAEKLAKDLSEYPEVNSVIVEDSPTPVFADGKEVDR